MKRHQVFFLLFVVVLFQSCESSDEKALREQLQTFVGKEIVIPSTLIPHNVPSVYADHMASKYKMISYIDKSLCHECSMRVLMKWTEEYKKYMGKDTFIYIIFNTSDYYEFQNLAERYQLSFPYFVDIDDSFVSVNAFLPKDQYLKTFLTTDGVVSIVGAPLNNKKLEALYLSVINGEK